MLGELKEYLKIGDTSEDGDLARHLETGRRVLDDFAGIAIDYEADPIARQLLYDYCRYARSHATEMFEKNYLSDLISLREKAEVEYEKNKDTA